jgi:hypothetical protein
MALICRVGTQETRAIFVIKERANCKIYTQNWLFLSEMLVNGFKFLL